MCEKDFNFYYSGKFVMWELFEEIFYFSDKVDYIKFLVVIYVIDLRNCNNFFKGSKSNYVK